MQLTSDQRRGQRQAPNAAWSSVVMNNTTFVSEQFSAERVPKSSHGLMEAPLGSHFAVPLQVCLCKTQEMIHLEMSAALSVLSERLGKNSLTKLLSLPVLPLPRLGVALRV
jgi:hypothetical protein